MVCKWQRSISKLNHLLEMTRHSNFFYGVGFGIAITLTFTRLLQPYCHVTYVWLYSSLFRSHWRAGMCCDCDIILKRDGYAMGYSYNLRSPMWVAYIACRNSIGLNLPIESTNFMIDTDLPKNVQAKPKDYLLTGYDRGHMAPCATINFSHRSHEQTMLLSNVCLQHPELNRHAWKSVENNIRKWIILRGKHAVAVGPIWRLERTSKVNGIGIPSAFFIAVYSYSTGETIGFHFPNKPVSAKDIWNYVVSIDELERLAKIKLFRHLPLLQRIMKYRRRHVSLEFWKTDK